jgi:CheY-like chemotaxis protein
MILSVLSPRGYRVLTAPDGHAALTILREAVEPFTVLLDIVMPLLDGLGVCDEIARDPVLRAAGHKLVLMSSTVRLSAPDMPPAAGHLAKPFTRQQLIEVVEAVGVTGA